VDGIPKPPPDGIRDPSQVTADAFLDTCWAIFKKHDVFNAEKLEGNKLWKAGDARGHFARGDAVG
jgi:hypothetical protein